MIVRFKAYGLFVSIRFKRGMRKGFPKVLFYLFTIFVFFILPLKYKAIILLYGWFRKIDDIIDGEENVPEGYSIDSYIDQKKSILNGNACSYLPEDTLFFYTLNLLAKKKIDLNQEIRDLFLAIETEYHNRGKLVKRKELFENMALQDKAALTMLAKVNGTKEEINPICLGILTKIDSLFDIEKDIKEGMINIPLEDALEMNLTAEEILTAKNLEDIPGFNEWYVQEVEKTLKKWVIVSEIIKGRQEMFLLNFICNPFKLKKNLKSLKISSSFFALIRVEKRYKLMYI